MDVAKIVAIVLLVVVLAVGLVAAFAVVSGSVDAISRGGVSSMGDLAAKRDWYGSAIPVNPVWVLRVVFVGLVSSYLPWTVFAGLAAVTVVTIVSVFVIRLAVRMLSA